MNNILSHAIRLISDENISSNLSKYMEMYPSKNINVTAKDENSNQKQLQLYFAFEEVSKSYNSKFKSEFNKIKEEITIRESGNMNEFSDFIVYNYKELMNMLYEKNLSKPSKYKVTNSDDKLKQLKYASRLVRYNFQNNLVTPVINLIEDNYISFLLNDWIFPIPVQNLIEEISNHKLKMEILSPGKKATAKFLTVQSNLNKQLYYLSYNTFSDLTSYNDYLNKVLVKFEEYTFSRINQLDDIYEKIGLFNQIRLQIKSTILLFSRLESTFTDEKTFPRYARNDTNALYNQYIREIFPDSQNIRFNPDLIDFQDLQFSIAKRAALFIGAKLNLLRDQLKLNENESKLIGGIPSVNHQQEKIKTELTVAQISYLFKCLYEEKDILEEKNKTALRNSISSCFTSKRREYISAESIRGCFNKPEDKTIEFWIEKFTHLLQFAKKERQNNRT